MVRKPNDKSKARSPVARGTARRAPTPAKSGAAAELDETGVAGLRRELNAARARIADLEKGRRDLAKRIESAIAAIHKLLES